MSNHSETGNGMRNGLKMLLYVAISSQAAWGQAEGSTTRLWSPDRTVKAHECASTDNGTRYSLSSDRKALKHGLNAQAITNWQQIWDISRIPLPLTDRIGTDSHSNQFTEWAVDELQAPNTANAFEDGAVTTAVDDTNLGNRKGNHSQISVKVVRVGTRARNVDTIGYADELSYQIMQRQRELRRDVEAIACSNQGSVKSASGTPGNSAGLGAWIVQGDLGSSTGGGWQSGTGLVTARTSAGDAGDRALTEAQVRATIKTVYEQGGESTVMMSTPSAIENWSNYLFTSSARVAALQSDVNQQRSAVTATGAVNVFVSDFGTVELVSNRLQQVEGTTTAVNVYILDPTMLRLSYLEGYRTEPLAKDGLADTRQVCVDWTLKVLNENAQGLIADIDQSAPAVAA